MMTFYSSKTDLLKKALCTQSCFGCQINAQDLNLEHLYYFKAVLCKTKKNKTKNLQFLSVYKHPQNLSFIKH